MRLTVDGSAKRRFPILDSLILPSEVKNFTFPVANSAVLQLAQVVECYFEAIDILQDLYFRRIEKIN